MAIYDTEEEQLEQLKKWWEGNSSSVVAGIVGAVLIVGGFSFWQNYQQENRVQASQLYQELLNSATAENPDSIEKIAEKLASEYSSSIYAHYAALQLAKTKVAKGDLEAAKAILEKEIKTNSDVELQHIARLRLIQLLHSEKQYEAGLQLIAGVDPAKMEGFAASYDELQGDLYLALDRLDEARNAYQSALRTGQASQLVQFKLDDITAPEFTPNPAK